MRTAHTWTVKVQEGGSGQVHDVTVQGHWDPEHALTESSVMSSGEYTIKARNKFKVGAAAIPDSVELVA